MKVYFDTGPLYALVERHDQWHGRTLDLLGRLHEARAELVCPYPTALELHGLLLKRKPSAPEAAHRTVRRVVERYPTVQPGDEDKRTALATLQRYADQRISLTDATIASMAGRASAQVLTFDGRHFLLMGADVCE